MSITLNDRQQQILERLNAEGEVKIAELREAFAVTEMTIRRDLEKLEAAGHAKRTFGGAIVFGNDIALQERAGYMTEEKRRIGKRAAERVLPGESVFIDGGSTTLQVARYLKSAAGITVVTNALNVAAELTGKQIPVIVTGGTLLDATASLVGPIAAGTVAGMAFDRAFLGTSGVSLLHGFSNSNMYEAEIKKLAIRQSAEVNVVLDHSKFGEKELVSFAAFTEVHRIITEELPQGELAGVFQEAGVEIMLG
ncbi:DeoR/GlpR family DNA-binding transcription regulator [Paenibacillus sepulcri]